MIFGLFFITVGYALFYWGIHHFAPKDPNNNAKWPKYSLKCVLGLQSLGLPTLQSPGDIWTTPPVPAPTGGGTFTGPAPNVNPPQNVGKAPQNWMNDILNGIQAPTSANNRTKLTAWNACEGNDNNQSGLPINNPFNVTWKPGLAAVRKGTNSVNSVGVQAYGSWSAGVAATVETLNEPFANAILINLKSDGPCAQFANAVGSSGWGTRGGCIAAYCGYVG